MKRLFVWLMALSMVLWAQPVWAISLETPGTSVELPEQAGHAPVFLGTAVDPQTGRLVQGYAFLKYKSAPAKPDNPGGNGHGGNNGGSTTTSSTCYGYMAKGAYWKWQEPWVMNPANNSGMNTATVFNVENDDVTLWEDAADGTLDGQSVTIMGTGTQTNSTLVADTVSPDGQNEVYFGSVDSPGAIAVTIVWGVWGGPPSGRYLAEWDQVFDEADYGWSLTGEAGKMDFDNIATHELGHSFGLDDLYTSECSQETMYGYADYGQTNKQTLEAGDITGISKLY